ncbi:MFS transporter [Frateuria aurantia]
MSSPTPDLSSLPLFRQRPFLAFWCCRIASSFAFQMLSVAAGWQIYALTHRAASLGLIGLIQFLPSVLLALPAGHFIDQLDRRKLILSAMVLEMLAVLGMALGSHYGHIRELDILLLVFVIGVAKAFEFPALQALLPDIVPGPLLARAMAANGAASQAASIVGPALGGFLYVAGADVVYALAAGLYLLGLLTLSSLLAVKLKRLPREPASLERLLAGVRFIRARPDVLGVISLDLFAVLLGGATALLPIFAQDILHTGPWGLGLLRAAPAAGALLMSLWLTRWKFEQRVGVIMFAAVAGFGVATMVFAVSSWIWLSLAALFALGAFDMISMVIRGAMVQLDTPDELRGRVSAVNSIFINTSNQLGEFESGMLAAWLGAVPAALLGGVGTLLVVAIWMRLFPGLRHRQQLHHPKS